LRPSHPTVDNLAIAVQPDESCDKSDDKLHDKPIEHLSETVRCLYGAGNTAEYTIIDCLTSTVSGEEFVVLVDGEGQKKLVTEGEFYELYSFD
jgi:hypothetical protein